MKHCAFMIIPAVFALSACAPLKTYYKPGASVTALKRDTISCEISALADVPASVQIRRKPPTFIPGTRTCTADGKCSGTEGYYIPGGVESYDPNDGLRARVEQQCMAAKGYVPVSIPACPDSVAKAAPPTATTRLPALTDASCVIRNRDGSFQIVTRG